MLHEFPDRWKGDRIRAVFSAVSYAANVYLMPEVGYNIFPVDENTKYQIISCSLEKEKIMSRWRLSIEVIAIPDTFDMSFQINFNSELIGFEYTLVIMTEVLYMCDVITNPKVPTETKLMIDLEKIKIIS